MIAGRVHLLKVTSGIAMALWLAACAVAPPVDDRSAGEQKARQAYSAGRYLEAAEAWDLVAAETAGEDQARFRLYSADAWLLAGRFDRAGDQLSSVKRVGLKRSDAKLYDLLQAGLALHSGDLEAAEFYLVAAQKGPGASYEDRYKVLNRRLLQMRSGPSSQQLALAYAAIRDMPAYQADQALDILRLLEDVPSGQLRILTMDSEAGNRNETWLQLALLIRETLFSGALLETSVREWSSLNPGFPGSAEDILDLSLRYRSLFRPPASVAVLLPAEGGLAAAGSAIRDGMLSAYLEAPAGSKLTFYNTGSEPATLVSAYFQALEDGADWVVGPLRRESVDQLAKLDVFNTPALVLNEPGTPVAGGQVQGLPFYHMSLSQDAEAARIATRSLESGLTRALVLVPDNTWGDRMGRAFTEAFTAGEGEIIASTTFQTAENDHSDLLKQLLKIDESIERNRRLENRLGIRLKFEPARRDDFDLIFLAASPTQGRQIKPQLKFHDAGSKPVFATARIYSGTLEPTANRDLNGIRFPLTQWQLEIATDGAIPDLESIRQGQLGALHAVGRDAWNVLPWLNLMEKDPDFVFPGAVGGLRAGQDGQLSREPAWAVFSGGRPVTIDWPATP
jgi:outer membrane PBP1 activator LpoA protein